MNHLHEVATLLHEPNWTGPLTPEQAGRALAHAKRPIAEAICFSMGDALSIAELKLTQLLLRLPFDTCWFECHVNVDGGQWQQGLLVQRRPATGTADFWWFERATGAGWALSAYGYWNETTPFDYVRMLPRHTEVERAFDIIMSTTAKFLTALNCINVERVEHTPSAALQRARQRRGKRPLFSYWTLHLRPNKASSDLGGTHASPRVHLVRGHAQRYSGAWKWKQPYAKGNKDLGMVHKDYRATPELLDAAMRRAA